ncbi:PRAME family member 7-like [Thomomys bottae]
MDIRTPPTLESLAMQGLLRSHSLARSALADVPRQLFPQLFREVYARGHTEMLKAIVQAWPFPCLSLRALTQSLDLEALKVALDGIDMLLAKRDRPRRWKLQVLDLQCVYCEIWAQGYPSVARSSPTELLTDQPTVSRYAGGTEERPLTIVLDLTFQDDPQEAFQAYLLQWARERKGRVRLWCKKLKILSGSFYIVQEALLVVSLDSIQDLLVTSVWHPETMKKFVPYLSQMKNLQVLNFSKMSAEVYTSRARNFLYSRRYAAHLGQLHCLQELHMHDVFFLRGKLRAILRNMTALKTLSLSSCPLQEADLKSLSRCACARQLQRLRLRSVLLGCFSPETLRALLKQAAGTLETLALEDCGLIDTHLSAILPVLRQCSHLHFFSFYGNCIPLAGLHKLLSHTAHLAHLSRGIYPVPLESFYNGGNVLEYLNTRRFAQAQASLAQTWRASGTRQRFQICIYYCHRQNKCRMLSLCPSGQWVFTWEGLPGLSAIPE